MMLLIGLAVLMSLALVLIAVPFLGRDKNSAQGREAEEFAAGQLGELDRQLETGTLAQADFDAAKSEIERRLLAAHKSSGAELSESKGYFRLSGVAIVSCWVVVGSILLYDTIGRPDLSGSAAPGPTQATLAPVQQQLAADLGSTDQMIADLAKRLAQSPDDAEGWRMLGWSHFKTGNYRASVAAYEKAVALDDRDPVIFSVLGEAIVRSENGEVSDRALAVFHQALGVDPTDPRARFFQGMALEQRGDPKGALKIWGEILGRAPADADWAPGLRARIEQLARSTGVDVENLPQIAPGPSASAGPDADDVAAAAQLSEQERQDMVRGMVQGLATRLQDDPTDTQGWIMLVRSYLVLRDTAAAKNSLQLAKNALRNDPEAFAQIIDQANQMGLE